MQFNEGRTEIIPDLDWDTLRVPRGSSIQTVNMFTEPISSHKSWNETSMLASGLFHAPQHKNVTNLQIAFGLTNNQDDTNSFRDTFRYEFQIGQKLYDNAPMSRFQWFANNDLELALFHKSSKRKRSKAAKKIQFVGNEVEYRIGDNPIGHHILQGQYFKIRLLADNEWFPKDDFKFVMLIKGIKSRGVQ